MPREVLPLETFDRGIVCSLDPENTPLNAAYWSEDVDPNYSLGGIIGRSGDTQGTGVTFLGAADYSWIQRNDGKYDLVYYGLSTGSPAVRIIKDFYGTRSRTVDPHFLQKGEKAGLVAGNKVVRAGFYRNPDSILPTVMTDPKWIGYIDNGQFGAEAPSGYIDGSHPSEIPSTEDAECARPNFNVFFYKVVIIGSYTYGVAFGGNHLYGITSSTGVEAIKSKTGMFTKIQGFCNDGDGIHVWVFDQNSTYGTLYKVKVSDMSIVLACPLGAYTLGENGMFSDMTLTTATGQIYFGVWYPDGKEFEDFTIGSTAKDTIVVFRTPKPSTSASLTLTDCSPSFGALTWYNSLGPGYVNPMQSMLLNLVTLSTTQVGYVCGFNDTVLKWMSTGGPSPTGCIAVVSDSYTRFGSYGIIVLPRSVRDFAVNGTVYYATNKALYTAGNNNRVYKDVISDLPTAGNAITATASSNTFSDIVSGTAGSVSFISSATVYMTRTRVISGVDSAIDSGVGGIGSLAEVCAGGSILASVEKMSGDGGFLPNTKYFYKFSFVYDGYQYSPLSAASVYDENEDKITSNKSIKIRIKDKTAISDRITHLCIWRASGGLRAATPDTQYRLALQKSIIDDSWVEDTSDKRIVSFSYIDSMADEGSLFDAITGFSETLDSSFIRWGIGIEYNSSLFVAKCIHPELTDASHMIFKSKKGRLDTFDWITDFLKLPEIPNAIVAFAGRLFVMSNNNTYKINPEEFYVEDVFKGVGAWSPKGVCVTEDVLYIADKENVYAYDGRNMVPIGEPIRTCQSAATVCSSDITTLLTGWKGVSHTFFYPALAWSSRLQSLLILVSTGANLTEYRNQPGDTYAYGSILAYTPARPGVRQYARWDYWSSPAMFSAGWNGFPTDLAGIVIGRDGEAYLSGPYFQYTLCANASARKAFTYYTGYIGGDNQTQKKRFYFALATGTFSAVAYDRDNTSGAYTTLTAGAVPITYSLRKYLKLKFTSAVNATAPFRSCDIVVRKLLGVRSYA